MKKFLAGMLVAHVLHKVNKYEMTPEQSVKFEATLDRLKDKIVAGAERLFFGPKK